MTEQRAGDLFLTILALLILLTLAGLPAAGPPPAAGPQPTPLPRAEPGPGESRLPLVMKPCDWRFPCPIRGGHHSVVCNR